MSNNPIASIRQNNWDRKKIGNMLLDNALFIIMLIAIIYIAIKNPNFLKPASIINILSQTAAYLPAALGIAGCIVLTGTDLSAGRIVGLTACISASLLQVAGSANKMWPGIGTLSIFIVIPLAMIIGAAIGSFNGFFVAKFKLHPFIVTLATQLIVYTFLLLYVQMGNNKGMAISSLDKSYTDFVKGSVLKIGNTPIPNVLQSQINPHFLYNTLDSVVWMNENGRTDEAILMVTSLARFFRISLSRGSNIIPLEDELEHARHYLNIQMMRYKNKFNATITAEPNVSGLYTIKLIVQPVLENAIYHGMACADGDGEISVHAFRDEDDVILEITDNGPGMTEEVSSRLLDQHYTPPDSKGSGIGLRNVHLRIGLTFGSQYGLTILSEPDEGTTVRIRIPALDAGQAKEYQKEGEL